MNIRIAESIVVLGAIMFFGSIVVWTLIQAYSVRHEFVELGYEIVAVATDWPYGTLEFTFITGFVLLVVGSCIGISESDGDGHGHGDI